MMLLLFCFKEIFIQIPTILETDLSGQMVPIEAESRVWQKPGEYSARCSPFSMSQMDPSCAHTLLLPSGVGDRLDKIWQCQHGPALSDTSFPISSAVFDLEGNTAAGQEVEAPTFLNRKMQDLTGQMIWPKSRSRSPWHGRN